MTNDPIGMQLRCTLPELPSVETEPLDHVPDRLLVPDDLDPNVALSTPVPATFAEGVSLGPWVSDDAHGRLLTELEEPNF